MRKWFSESNAYGKLILLIGLLIGAPMIVAPFYAGEAALVPAFAIPSAASVALGAAICALAGRGDRREAHRGSPAQAGSLTILIAWCYAILAGAAPFWIGGRLNGLLAAFESVSGWTTTGLTVVEIEALPKIYLFHRAFMQYCGGLGFMIMIAMIVSGKHNVSLYNAEGHPDRLAPSLMRTSQIIFSLYGFYLIAGSAAYRAFGMGWFDAVCHTMSALSTAGFSTRAGSIGSYGSRAIEAVTVALMLIGSTNFAILFLLVKRRFRQIARVSEFRFMLLLIAVTVPLAAIALAASLGMGYGEGLMEALFGVVTTFTTTGYSTMTYALWPPFALGIVMLLMIIGGSVGSTAGGIKLSRAYLIGRIAKESVAGRLAPARRVASPTYRRAQGEQPIDSKLILDTFGFVACYMGVYIVGSLLLTLTSGRPLFDAMFEFSSAFGTVGISNGLTGAGASAGSLIVLMAGMLLGRLEIFLVFYGLYAAYKAAARRIGGIAAKLKGMPKGATR